MPMTERIAQDAAAPRPARGANARSAGRCTTRRKATRSSGRFRRARRSRTCRRIGRAPTARRRRTSSWCWPMTSVTGDGRTAAGPVAASGGFVSRWLHARMRGPRVRQSRARRRGGRLRAVAGSLARRDADAVVHEPDPGTARRRRMAIAQAGGEAELPVPRRVITISSARTTTLAGEYQLCSLFSPLLQFDDQETARLVAQLAREALFDAANAEDGGHAGRQPVARTRVRSCGARPHRPTGSATHCAAIEARLPARPVDGRRPWRSRVS